MTDKRDAKEREFLTATQAFKAAWEALGPDRTANLHEYESVLLKYINVAVPYADAIEQLSPRPAGGSYGRWNADGYWNFGREVRQDEQIHGDSSDDHFGVCPHCHKADGYANAGKSHRFYCKEHKVSWGVGSNLLSSWRDQTEEEQRRIWNEIGLNDFADVIPYHAAEIYAFGSAVNFDTDSEELPF